MRKLHGCIVEVVMRRMKERAAAEPVGARHGDAVQQGAPLSPPQAANLYASPDTRPRDPHG